LLSLFRARSCVYKQGQNPEGGKSCTVRKCDAELRSGPGEDRCEMVQGGENDHLEQEVQGGVGGQIASPGGGSGGEERCWGVHL